jgi:hypothetical protein
MREPCISGCAQQEVINVAATATLELGRIESFRI